MALQILLIWAKGPPTPQEDQAVKAAITAAGRIFGHLTLEIWGEVNREEEGPLPNLIGYTEDQDFLNFNSVDAAEFLLARDFYLDANHRFGAPVYILFIVPAGDLHGCNGFAFEGGYCSVLPVPTGVRGTADGHTYAHEIGHGLSLVHSTDTANLMFPSRTVPPSALSGDGITVDQYRAMRTFLQANPALSSKD